MEGKGEDVSRQRLIDARARGISHNVRCTECGHQSIEESQADVAVLLRKLIREQVREGKSDKEIYKKLQEDFGETVLYEPKFDLQTAGLWLSPLLISGAAAGFWAYQKHRQNSSVQLMTTALIKGIPLTPKERETIVDILTPPRSELLPFSNWWRRFSRR